MQTTAKRKRGMILSLEGWQKFQEAKLESEFEENSGNRYTLEELSERAGLDIGTVSKVLNRTDKVDKRTINLLFGTFNLKLDESCYSYSDPNTRQDWGEAVSVSVFYGRTAELATLEQCIVSERCRLVSLLGMGGIGKSALSIKLAEQIQDKFEYVIWRSLREAPPVEAILANLIQFLSDEQELETDLPKSLGGRISRLIHYLRKHRCLLVLDNVESILRSGGQAGRYIEGYEGYGQLLKQVGEVAHQSCLVLTSREKPKELASLEGETLPVRSFPLSGLRAVEGQEIFKIRGLSGSESEVRTLVEHYGGNALALKMIATTVQNLFAGSISEFLNQGTAVFGDIRDLLDQQFERLSDLEKEIVYWLAINREPVSFCELRSDMVSPAPHQKLLEALDSLVRRSLIERNAALFSLQSVVTEYVTQRLIEQVCEEIITHSLQLFRCHALMKAQGKDYVRDTQVRLILKPVIDGLLAVFRNQKSLENQLTQILATLRETSPLEPGYTAGNVLNLLGHLETNLSGYDFSHLTVWQADLRKVNLHKANFQNANLAKSVFADTLGGIHTVAFSPDGKILATGTTNRQIRLYQIADGKQLLNCTGHTGWLWSVAFSPDGRVLASGSDDQTVKLWDTSNGQCLATLQGHSGGIWSVAFNSDGRILASASEDQTIKLWDAITGQCRKTLSGHSNRVSSVAFSPNGQIATGSHDQTVRLWDINTGQCLKIFQGHSGGIWSVAFSPNGQIATGSHDQTVRLWDISTGQCLKIFQGHTDCVNSVIFSPDNHTLASGGDDQTVKLWDVSTGCCITTLREHSSRVWSIAFNPDERTLASGSSDQTVRLWDVNAGQCFKTLRGYRSGIWAIAFSYDGHMLVSGSGNQLVKLWDAETGKCLKTLRGHSNRVTSVFLSPNGLILASGSEDQTVKLWDVSTGQCLKTLQGHSNWLTSVSLSPNGLILASGSDDQTVKLWDINTGQCIQTLEGHTDRIWSVTFNPNGQTLASGCHDQTMKLWDISTGQCIRTLLGHDDLIWSSAYSPDGRILASGSGDRTVKLWDVSTGQCIQTLEGHTSSVYSVAFSPDGHMLVSGSGDQSVKLWDVSSGRCLKSLAGHTELVWSVAFSPMGQTLTSGSQDDTIKFWDVKTGECLKTLQNERPYESMNITGITGVTEAQTASLKALGAFVHEEVNFSIRARACFRPSEIHRQLA